MATKTTKNSLVGTDGRTFEFILIGGTERTAPAGFHVCRRFSDLQTFLLGKSRDSVVVSSRPGSTEGLIRALMETRRAEPWGSLLTIEQPRPESIPSLTGLFGRVIGAIGGYQWLPRKELFAVLSGEEATDRFIGGAADSTSQTLTLVRGDLSQLVIPFAFFSPSGDGEEADFSKPSFADYGYTVALGEYEASADGILYEFDAAYRRKLKKARIESDQSFGASLRRLRLQRGLKRSDFAPVASKTIARIERSEVDKPRGDTLETIARQLGVSSEQIESY